MNAADIPARCLFEANPYEFAIHRMEMLTETFELLWGGTINALPCLLHEYAVGDRVEIYERALERTPQGMRDHRTGRELYGWVAHVGIVNQSGILTLRFTSRTFPVRAENEVKGRMPVFFPMAV